MAILTLSRVARQTDFTKFEPEDLNLIADLGLLDGQHPMRAWEYAIVLEALRRWGGSSLMAGEAALDVGGAGSMLWKALTARGLRPQVLDPAVPPNVPLEGYRGRPVPVVTCISVLEHVPDLDDFLRRLAGIVVPGGLLVLTTDYHTRGDLGDRFHFHWMRRRIFGPFQIGAVSELLAREGFMLLGGGLDLEWEPTVYDYGFFSLVLVKEG